MSHLNPSLTESTFSKQVSASASTSAGRSGKSFAPRIWVGVGGFGGGVNFCQPFECFAARFEHLLIGGERREAITKWLGILCTQWHIDYKSKKRGTEQMLNFSRRIE